MRNHEKPRYLTKGRFVRALSCPTKLYYMNKPDRYPDNLIGDEFLEALAQGGFQVGALAQAYYPDGHLIETLDGDAAVAETSALLAEEKAVVFEAAIRHESLFIRADILVKDGACLNLIEVKAKSCDDEESFVSVKTGGPIGKWKKYLYDVAFQKYVLQKAFPGHIVRAHLMLADKSSRASVDGLNQIFRLDHTGGRTSVRLAGPVTPTDLGDHVLIERDVDAIANDLIGDGGCDDTMGLPFSEFVDLLASSYARDALIKTPVGAKCKKCEFRASPEQEAQGLCSGFKECWKTRFGLSDEDFAEPNIFEIWKCGNNQKIIDRHKFLLRDVIADDISELKEDDKTPGLSASQRQHLQFTKARNHDLEVYIDREGLQREFASYTYPLHFIDFETSAVALPFHAGRRPYEGIAFQFSHHTVDEDGNVRHVGQYVNIDPGTFPNYDFLRALKQELQHDDGTVFRYATHENTYLLHIYDQLRGEDAAQVPDRDELCDWIRTITESKEKSHRGEWVGARTMVDMCELVKRYYYDPFMRGSNSIKVVLPAVLRSSDYLKARYSQPIYGAADGIPSLNYTDWVWVQSAPDGQPQDPYKLLPPIDTGLTDEQLLELEEDHLNNGGAAMVAYARLQFEDVPPQERLATKEALLRYCELDTLAMVMIWEAWQEMLNCEWIGTGPGSSTAFGSLNESD